MVIARLTDGMGNQLFQYAMGWSLAERHGVPFKLDLRWFASPPGAPGLEAFTRTYKLGHFNTTAEIASPAEIDRFVLPRRGRFDPRRAHGLFRRLRRFIRPPLNGFSVFEKGSRFDPSMLNLPNDVYVSGYYQSEAYFRGSAKSVSREFTLRDASLQARAAAQVTALRKGTKPLISVHVRRGDVAKAHEELRSLQNMPYPLLSPDYFRRAMAALGEGTHVVFSDTAQDLEWCRKNIKSPDIHFLHGESDLDDFAAMQACDHHIISNSSFSWWAAWLNPSPAKKVIAPRDWFYPHYFPDSDIHSIIPPEWTIL